MKNPAIVKFIGNQNEYKLGCGLNEWKYCHDCQKENNCTSTQNSYEFTLNKEYHSYFLEYWQGVRDSLHVKNNKDEIVDYIPFEDFSITEDIDNVLNYKEATVRCITKKYDNELFEIKCGKEYKAIGITNKQFSKLDYLVMDESYDCYFYAHSLFEIVEDIYGILDKKTGIYVYDSSIFED